MSTKFLSPGWRMPRNANQSKISNYSIESVSNVTGFVKIPGLANSLNLTDKVSISIWWKTSTFQNNRYIMGFKGPTTANGFDLGMHGSNIISYAAFSGSSSGNPTVNFAYDDGNWHHYVLTYNGSIRKLYIDGILKAESAASGNMLLDSNGDFYMLGTNAGAYGGIGKAVDNCVFDYALSDGGVSVGSTATGQIADLYGDGLSLPNPMALPTPPIAYYPLGTSAWNGQYLAENNAIGDYVFDFVGTSSQEISLTTSNLPSANSSFSMSVWLNRDSTVPSYAGVLSFGDLGSTNVLSMAYINFDTSNNIKYGFYNGDAGNTAISANNWHHVVLTYNGTNATFYINGQVVGIPTQPGTLAIPTTSTLKIGGLNTSAQTFNGKISNAQIFNAVLSGPEVETLYNYGSPIQTLANIPQSSNLKAWYKLDATEIYNSTSTEWSVDNNKYPSAYPSSLSFVPNDYINCGSPSSLDFERTDAFSISAWVKRVGSGSYQSIVYKANNNSPYNGYAFYIDNNNKVGFNITIDYTSNNYFGKVCTSVLNTDWNNVLITYNGNSNVSGVNIYINGSLQTVTTVGTSSDLTGTLSNSIPFNIGARNNTDVFLDGKLSNTQVFNTALPETGSNSVETIYNNGAPLTDMSSFSSLVSWWKLNNTTTGIGNYLSNYTTAVDFNYLNTDYLSLGTMSTLSAEAEVTFSIWAKITKPGGTQGFSMIYTDNSDGGTGNKGIIYIEPSGNNARVKCTLRNTSSLRTSLVNHTTFNSWHNITVTFGTTYAKLYLNGQLQDTEAVGTAANLGVNAFLGRYSSTSPVYATGGLLSNFAIFNSELSGPQVLTLFNGGTPETSISFSPVHHWKLNDINTGLNDIGSLASNNATRGAAATGTVSLGPTTASSLVSSLSGTNNGATEYAGFVNTLAGDSTGMSQSNLVQSDLQTVAPYSKYAMSFDGLSDKIDCGVSPFDETTGDITISAWVKRTAAAATYAPIVSATQGVGGADTQFSFQFYGNSLSLFWKGLTGGDNEIVPTSAFTVANDVWYLVNFVRTGTTGRFYVNGNLIHLSTKTYDDFISTGIPNLSIGAWWFSSNVSVTGSISNVSIWNTALTPAQVREIYNEGLPSNLHNFSGAAPVAWWQLGENSSFTGDWICADEIGSSNGDSGGMGVDALTNGVGTTANGTSTGMSEGSLIGDAPYSTANAMSSGMPITARGTDVPS